jgi:exosome complex RNA-binding protein Rrp42 (RNase PH superfamily)
VLALVCCLASRCTVSRILSAPGVMDLAQLGISAKRCWVLYIDAVVGARDPHAHPTSSTTVAAAAPHARCMCVVYQGARCPFPCGAQVFESGGNLVDTLTVAAYAALKDTRYRERPTHPVASHPHVHAPCRAVGAQQGCGSNCMCRSRGCAPVLVAPGCPS